MSSQRARRALNPAFATAHGLASSSEDCVDVVIGAPPPTVTGTGAKRIDLILKEARATGKLQAANAGLTAPLPDTLFDFRGDIAVDLSMNATSSNDPPAAQHVEETLTLVDLSDNDLKSSLDGRVTRFQQVQTMRWKRCGLTNIVDLTSLETLVVLDLSGNRLDQFDLEWLPGSATGVGALQDLNLAKNQLRGLKAPSDIQLDHLLTLDLSENLLQTFDSAKLSCPRLRTFCCSHNKLKELPTFLESAKGALQSLDASYNQLCQSSMNLSGFSKLENVVLAFNRLVGTPCIPTSVFRLDLSTNKIESIEQMFVNTNDSSAEGSALMDLLLQDNYLVELDATMIAKCTRIQRLDLSANKLRTLPYQLGFLAQLQNLSLAGNPLFSFKASDIERPIALLQILRNRAPKPASTGTVPPTQLLHSSLVHNTTINLSKKGKPALDLIQLVQELKSNPTTAFGISGKFILESNGLDNIPDDLLAQFPNLGELSLSDNVFSTLPPSLAVYCPRLTRLHLSRNKIADLDLLTSVSTLPWSRTLVRLDLSTNRLASFRGDLLQKLTSLEVLNLSFNKLTSVQDWQRIPSTLTHLDLSENVLETVDELVLLLGAQCAKLEVLSLQHNYIRRIPATLGLFQERCPQLKLVDLKGNPQHGVRPEVLTKPVTDQLTYLMNRMTVEQVTCARQDMDRIETEFGGTTEAKAPMATTDASDYPANVPGAKRSETSTGDLSHESVVDDKASPGKPVPNELILQLKINIQEFERQLDSPSLSQAKRYAIKKSLAMERSKLIREERKLGLRK